MQKNHGGTYSLTGDFSEGRPTLIPNECHFELVSPADKEEVVDVKKGAKGQVVKPVSPFSEEEE